MKTIIRYGTFDIGHLVQDIDTLEDWKRVEILFRILKESEEF